jgi:hypothetical protein
LRLFKTGDAPDHRQASPEKIKNRLLFSVVGDRIAKVLHILAEPVHRVATGETHQQPGQCAQRKAAP